VVEGAGLHSIGIRMGHVRVSLAYNSLCVAGNGPTESELESTAVSQAGYLLKCGSRIRAMTYDHQQTLRSMSPFT
jgi:hypothetical protein